MKILTLPMNSRTGFCHQTRADGRLKYCEWVHDGYKSNYTSSLFDLHRDDDFFLARIMREAITIITRLWWCIPVVHNWNLIEIGFMELFLFFVLPCAQRSHSFVCFCICMLNGYCIRITKTLNGEQHILFLGIGMLHIDYNSQKLTREFFF